MSDLPSAPQPSSSGAPPPLRSTEPGAGEAPRLDPLQQSGEAEDSSIPPMQEERPRSTPLPVSGSAPAWAPVVQNPYGRIDAPKQPSGDAPARSYNPAEYSSLARAAGDGLPEQPKPNAPQPSAPQQTTPPAGTPSVTSEPPPVGWTQNPPPLVTPAPSAGPSPYPAQGYPQQGTAPRPQQQAGQIPPAAQRPQQPQLNQPFAQQPRQQGGYSVPLGDQRMAPMPQQGMPQLQRPSVPQQQQVPPGHTQAGAVPYVASNAPAAQQGQWHRAAGNPSVPNAYALRSEQSRRCPYCASVVPAAAVSCPVCRSDLNARAHAVRCRSCGEKAPSSLALCPHCGLELRAAPPRWLTILVPLLLLAMIAGLIALGSTAGNEEQRLSGPLGGLQAWFAGLTEGLDPQVALIPAAETPALTNVTTPAAPPPADASASAGFTEGVPGGVVVTDTVTNTVGVTSSAGISEAPPVEEPTAAATEAPEAVATATPTAVPTLPPTPAATTTPIVHTVAQGETALGIAVGYGVDIDELQEANGLSAAQAALLQPGQTLVIPPTPAPVSVDPNATQVPGVRYVVQPGDTLVGIAVRQQVSMEAIMAANDLTEDDAASLRPDDVLIIPQPPTPTPAPATATPLPTPTSAATATPTPAPTATPAPTRPAATATPAAILRLDAPVLVSPADGAALLCSENNLLVWQAPTGGAAGDRMRVRVGFVKERAADGSAVMMWIIDQPLSLSTTQAALDPKLCTLAPDTMDNEWRWVLEVVDSSVTPAVPASLPSEEWSFTWK